jgi:putative transposase
LVAKTTFKFRLYPDANQEERMAEAVENCRRLWNMALEDRMARWQEERRSTTYWQQCLTLTAEARRNPAMRSMYMQTLQDVLKRVDRAFKRFFSGDGRLPRFKEHKDWGSLTYPQAYNGSVKLDLRRRRLRLSKVGDVKIVIHRQIPAAARLKTCIVKCEPDGKWFACLVYEGVIRLVDAPQARISPLGIDLGLKSLITTSDGEKVEPPKFFRKSERRLARLHRALSNKRSGSSNRVKARLKLAAQYTKVSNQRRDVNHKLSDRLARDHGLIVFEDLRIRNLMRNHSLAKSIKDASWGQLIQFTEYKVVRAGVTLVKVSPEFSTQECWFCGTRNNVSLETREFVCGGCARILDRDRNASRIVLKRGILQVGRDKDRKSPRPVQENPGQAAPKLKPVETEPLPPRTTGDGSSAVEAGTRSGNSPAGSPRSHDAGGCHKAAALAYPYPDMIRDASGQLGELWPLAVGRGCWRKGDKPILKRGCSGHDSSAWLEHTRR